MEAAGGQSTERANIPLTARLALARAAVQVIADDAGADLLHIKGDAVDTRLRPKVVLGTDVDALVRPAHVLTMHEALLAHGWQVFSTFDLGSPFGHAQTYAHDTWGFFDLHRRFPGIRRAADDAFDLLWRERRAQELRGARGWVPSIHMQATLLVLNDARDASLHEDPVVAWITNPGLDPDEIASCVAQLGAQTAFAAATGTLESRRGAADYPLWRAVSQGGTRTAEWWGRIRASETRGDAARLAKRALQVNVEQLRHDLGHEPSRGDIVRAFLSRQLLGAKEIIGRFAARSPR
ncbi:hypothetical protein GCM10027414_31940 [Humibacter ginsengiterrae]